MIGILIQITSSAIGLTICPVTAGTKKHKSVIQKMKKKHDKIVLLPKFKLNSIEVLIAKSVTDSNTSHEELVSINNGLKQYQVIKE